MASYGKAFLWGMGISAVGALPLGILNVAAMQVAVSEGLIQGVWFSLGVAMVEVLYVRLSLLGIHWIGSHGKLLRWMDWIAFLIVLFLAVGSFVAAMHPGESKSIILQSNLPFFVLGLIMSALNPVQIPFWFGWTAVLFSKKILHARADYYNWYIAGIGLGTLLGLALFVFGGSWLVNYLDTNNSTINYAIGTVFLLTAIIQLIKILRHKGLANTAESSAIKLEKAELEDEMED